MAGNGTPQSSPFKGRSLSCKVLMLDDTTQTFQISLKSTGLVLYEAVINKLQLLESDYFDLQYNDTESIPCWLDHEKPILKQVTRSQLFFKFLLKFYTPDPGLLEEEYTRYLLALQIKRDLLSGDLYCQEHTAVLLASYIVQAEVGNFCEDYVHQSYISNLHLLPNQSPEVEQQIMEHHKEHMGQTPAEADFNLLDTARKVELYGIQLHPAQDHDGANLHLAVSHSGILVFQNYTKINSFSWAKIRKLCFKRKKFLIKLHPEGLECFKDTVEFYFLTRNWSKTFWKKCIEHHTFFRCHAVKHVPRPKAKVISHGSSFRYCGRTQKELVDYAREKSVKPVPFERTTSMRTMSALHSPKTGTLNSRDLSFGGALTSTSSGSRTLDRTSQDNSANVYRAANMHDQKMAQPAIPESTFRSYQLQSPSSGFPSQFSTPPSIGENNHRLQNSPTPDIGHKEDGYMSSQSRLDPSQFMLSRGDGRSSAPSLVDTPLVNSNVQPENDCYLSRTSEIEDIPERVRESKDLPPAYLKLQTLHQSQSETPLRNTPNKDTFETSVDMDELPPPPPPPVYQSDMPRDKTPRLVREPLDNSLVNVTSKSNVSGVSMTLMSNSSMRSCHTDESEDDRKKKKVPTATLR